jgi:iron complex outermembrane receptor protein
MTNSKILDNGHAVLLFFETLCVNIDISYHDLFTMLLTLYYREDKYMRVKEIGLLCSLISILVLGSAPYAAEVSADENTGPLDVFTLGEIVVTGRAETVTQVATVETIDRTHMDLTNSVDISSALDTLPGVVVSKGVRNEANINVRGFNERYVPVFFDGIPWYAPYDGYIDASEISTGNISRITLTKGAASSLYGANTMGGVINIISRKPQERFEGSYRFDMDTDGYSGSLNVGSKIEKFYFMAGISGLNLDGFKMSGDFTPVPAAGWFEDGGDRDNSYTETTTTSIKIGFTPAEGHEYAFGYHGINSEKGLPPNVYPAERQRFWKTPEWEKATYYLIGDSKIFDKLTAKIRVYHDEYYNIFDAYDDSTYTTQNKRSSWHSTYDDHTDGGSLVLRTDFFDKNTISFSYHLKNDVHESQGDYNEVWEKYEAETSSYGLEDAIIINDKTDLVLGVNMDVQKAKYANGGPVRGDDTSWNGLAGLIYYFENDAKLHVSIASKSRFPTLKELYSSYLDTAIPNPKLKKEKSVNYEIGVAGKLPCDSGIGLTLFYSDVKDLITETLVGGLDFNDNIGESRFQGVEFIFNTEYIPRNSIYLSYTYLEAENRSPDRTSDLISGAPEQQFYISDSVSLTERFSLFAKAKYDKGQCEETNSAGWIELDDYWIFDIKAIMQLSEKFQLEAGARNIFDENYETSYGFPREGRALFFGISGRF